MRIALIGNCQVQTHALLASAMLANAELRVFDYSKPYSRDEDQRRRFADGLAEVDLVLAQTALLSHTSERVLQQRYPGKTVTIANFYFRGLFPDSCYVGDFAHRLTDPCSVNSIVVLDAFRRGLSAAQALGEFSVENMDRLGLFDAWPSSMAELKRREANGVIDVPAADLVEDACRRYPAFLTMNHPSIVLLAEYFQMICTHAGLPTRPINAQGMTDPLIHHDTTPVHDEVAEYLELPYRTTQRWKLNSLDQRHVTRAEYVAACYKAYSHVDPAFLLANSPTDLVARFRVDPQLAYLVETGRPKPSYTGISGYAPFEEGEAPLRPDRLQPTKMVAGALDEVKGNLRRVLSYMDVIDPKLEHVASMMDQDHRRRQARLSRRLYHWLLPRRRQVAAGLGLALVLAAGAMVALVGNGWHRVAG